MPVATAPVTFPTDSANCEAAYGRVRAAVDRELARLTPLAALDLLDRLAAYAERGGDE